jgi:hypothetical protein
MLLTIWATVYQSSVINLLEVLVVHLKVDVSQMKFEQLHDGFDLSTSVRGL